MTAEVRDKEDEEIKMGLIFINFKEERRKRERTFKDASSLKPFSTKSMLSIFPSPVMSLKSRASLFILAESSPDEC